MTGSPRTPSAAPGAPRTFQLVPFEPASAPAGVGLTGDLSRTGGQVRLRYRLADPDGALRIPPAASVPARRDALWESTCLELFLAVPGCAAYWEVNLSPGGDWNVYRLSGYRQGLAAEPAIAALPITVTRRSDGLDLELQLDLAPLVAADQPLQVAITAVLEERAPAGSRDTGPLSYWALGHPGPEADFHHRDGFLMRI